MTLRANILRPIDGLGTRWYFELFEEIPDTLEQKIINQIHSFERSYSRFLADSLLSILNKNKILIDPPKEFQNILQLGLKYYQTTNTVFTLSGERALSSIGYDDRYTLVAEEKRADIPELTTSLEVNEQKIILYNNASLDLGGIGKGFLIDKIALMLLKEGIQFFVINAGGDIFVTSDNGKPIELYLEHPTQKTSLIGSVCLQNQALAVSSPFKRAWKDSVTGIQYNHILSENVVEFTSFVIAETATEADVWATTLIAASEDQRSAFVLPKTLSYKLLDKNAVTVSSYNWPV